MFQKNGKYGKTILAHIIASEVIKDDQKKALVLHVSGNYMTDTLFFIIR